MAEEEEIRLQMDPTSLPSKVAESIFKLLPIKDILSCCLVSSSWRDAINTDNIWKPFCKADINLENVPCVIKPKFNIHQNEHLTSICGERLKYMREIRLRNNFKHNSCVVYKIKEKSLVRISTIHFVSNYRFLILNSIVGKCCQNCFDVWDMEHEQAPFYVQKIRHLLKQDPTDVIVSLGDCLLIIQGILFQIYTAVEGKLTLKLCRVTNREETFSQSIPASDKIEAWYAHNVRLTTPGFLEFIEAVAGTDKYLFCLFRSLLPDIRLNTSVIHIWDRKSGKKLKIENLPEIPEIIQRIALTKTSEYLYIILLLPSGGCKVYSYELQLLQYTQFYLYFDHFTYFLITEKRVIGFDCDENEYYKKYILIDSITGTFIVQKETENPIYIRMVQVNDSLLAFPSGNTLATTVTVVDLRTSNEVAVLQVHKVPNVIFFLDYNLLLVGKSSDESSCRPKSSGKSSGKSSCKSSGRSSAGNNSLEVWDIEKRRKLYRMKNTLLVGCGASLLRLCVKINSEIQVLNYW